MTDLTRMKVRVHRIQTDRMTDLVRVKVQVCRMWTDDRPCQGEG